MSEGSGRPLPSGWLWVQLRELLLPAPTTNPRARPGERFAYIDIEAVDNRLQRVEWSRELLGAAAPSRARNQVAAGDVIFSLVRPYLKNIATVPSGLKDPVASTAFFVCRTGKGVDSRFLFNFFRQNSFIDSIVTYGNSPPAARDDEFERLLIPVAPEREQSRIADALDELLSDLDAGVKALESVRAKLSQYRAAVLKAAMEGTLTAEWRKAHTDVEPASELLKRILAERHLRWEEAQLKKYKDAGKEPPKNWRTRYKEPTTLSSDQLNDLPKGWCYATVLQLSHSVVDGTHHTPSYVESGVAFVSVKDVRNGRIDFSNCKYISEEEHELFSKRCNPEDDDILITKSGTIGRTAIVKTREPFSLFVSVALIKTIKGLFLQKYFDIAIQYWIQSISIAQQIKGGVIKNLHLEDLRIVLLRLCPVSEQSAIVDTVEAQFSVIDHLDSDIEAKLRSVAALRQSILKAAFEGKLVPQDPNDEPGSELLKRIATERTERERLAKEAKKAPKVAKVRTQKREQEITSVKAG